MNIETTGKACTRCGVFYAYAEGFHRQANGPGGRTCRCKICIRETTKPAPTVERVCKWCRKTFAVSVYAIAHEEKAGRRAPVTCSAECRCSYRVNPARRCVRNCARCSKPFETWANRVIPQKYCGPECAGIKAPPIAIECETCREIFHVPPRIARKGRRYCSRECSDIGRSTSDAPPIKNRFAKRSWEKLRLAVIARDDWRCRMCGTDERLHVHHVVPWIETHDDSPANLVTLCAGCHMKADLALRHHGEVLCDNGTGGGLS